MADPDSEDSRIRPDVRYTMLAQKTDEEDLDLEAEEKGFHCHSCGWRGLTYPMMDSVEDLLTDVCPECGEEGVENKLSTHIERIKEIYTEEVDNNAEHGFIPYTAIINRFEPPQPRFDEALNHLLTHDKAWVVFEDGRPLVKIRRNLS